MLSEKSKFSGVFGKWAQGSSYALDGALRSTGNQFTGTIARQDKVCRNLTVCGVCFKTGIAPIRRKRADPDELQEFLPVRKVRADLR